MSEKCTNYGELQRKQYNSSLRKLTNLTLAVSPESAVSDLVIGPKYFTKTKKGLPLKISTFAYYHKKTYVKTKESQIAVIAENQNGDLVGHRVNALREANGSVTSSGEITVALRNHGLTVPIELVFMDFVQRYSDKPVNWYIDNDNLKMLKRYRAQFGNTTVKREQELLQQLETEQERWKSIYWQQGNLGFSPQNDFEAIKTLTPIGSEGNDLDKVERISFTPVVVMQNGRHVYTLGDVVLDMTNDVSRYKEKMMNEFTTSFVPKIIAKMT